MASTRLWKSLRAPKNLIGSESLIAASHNGSRLLRDLSQVLSEPFFLLYVLVIPRGGSLEGRYQSDELSRAEVDMMFERFGRFWDGDGRHSIWLRSHTDDATLVYDRHNLIYAYGPLERFESVLMGLGYSTTPQLSFAFVHQHAYHEEFDALERDLTTRFADRRSDLHRETRTHRHNQAFYENISAVRQLPDLLSPEVAELSFVRRRYP